MNEINNDLQIRAVLTAAEASGASEAVNPKRHHLRYVLRAEDNMATVYDQIKTSANFGLNTVTLDLTDLDSGVRKITAFRIINELKLNGYRSVLIYKHLVGPATNCFQINVYWSK